MLFSKSVFSTVVTWSTEGMKILNFYSSTAMNSTTAFLIPSSLPVLKEKGLTKCFLLYRGSQDGFTAQSFHAKCDSHTPTLTIIKTSGHDPQIFGGYTTQTWNPVNGNYKRDSESFIFKYHDSKCMFEILPNSDSSTGEAIYAMPNNLTCFGGGCDFSIADKCNENKKSYCNLGYSYTIPQSLSNFQHEDAEVRSYLAGSKNFKVSEIEVYKVN
ncbi:hypothetical protein C9374_011433 [Naegleria lovaniensis]|uniref:TLDc domain-containing protein n=1 Tax=Naegleria lovaniensis TaxID=51637 RepID=A0AA88KP19_NAELO|nr:uncharacterized protein C9374_011433 [Naegleria lovaniensis]KAG2392708.1 hypothetical protein C9374_011433 [Naegleria lovaniensis]